MGPVKSFRIK